MQSSPTVREGQTGTKDQQRLVGWATLFQIQLIPVCNQFYCSDYQHHAKYSLVF
jgi:hypothetical protein